MIIASLSVYVYGHICVSVRRSLSLSFHNMS